MTSWTDMRPVQFDQTLVKSKAREFVATAGATMFPALLPEAEPKTVPAPAELPGQAELFGEEDTG